MANILILEDSEENYFLLQRALEADHTLYWAKTVAEATQKFKEQKNIDLALVDIQLPDGDGFQFTQWVRTNAGDGVVPIMFVSANSSVESRITGFMIGGDDYISKPFNFVELKARIDAKLRRTAQGHSASISVGDISVDLRTQKAHIQEHGNQVDLDLTPIEFKILNLLLAEPNRVFERDEILNKVWGADIYVYPRSVDTHVSKLRKKLRSKSSSIRSVHGIGYKFIPLAPRSVGSSLAKEA